MGFTIVDLELTSEQLAKLEEARVAGEGFGLLAQPNIQTGRLSVYFCTTEQTDLLQVAIQVARGLRAYGTPELWEQEL